MGKKLLDKKWPDCVNLYMKVAMDYDLLLFFDLSLFNSLFCESAC
jgi:hypothetical protein